MQTDRFAVRPFEEPPTTRFLQSCPTCGRTASIRTENAGCDVYCGHCLCRFLARDPSTMSEAAVPTLSLLERAEQLLRTLESPIVLVSELRR